MMQIEASVSERKEMSRSQASCQFCSRPDDSIQVLCESRCLLCSRCQNVPVIRRLLIDHTEFITNAQYANNASIVSHEGADNGGGSSYQPSHSSIAPTIGNTSSMRKLPHSSKHSAYLAISGECPICGSPVSMNMLALIQSYQEDFRILQEDEAAVH